MKTDLQNRLQILKAEFERGQRTLAELEAQQIQVRQTLLRISGAIQVLEECLGDTQADSEIAADVANNGHQSSELVETSV